MTTDRIRDLEHHFHFKPSAQWLAIIFVLGTHSLLAQAPLPESRENTIGYRTVDEALTALRMRPDVEMSEQGGWTIVADKKNATYWSFAPKGSPPYPAVVKRTVFQEGDTVKIKMDALCQAAKEPCDAMVREFQDLNENLRRSMQQGPTSGH